MSEAEHIDRVGDASVRDALVSLVSSSYERIQRLSRLGYAQIPARRRVLSEASVCSGQRGRNEGAAASHRSFGAFAVRDGSAFAYEKDAFHYFLEIERKRCDVSHRPLLLLLIDLEPERASEPRSDEVTAAGVISTLSQCVRDTDFVGWYCEGVIGAVLTQDTESPREDLAEVVRRRVGGQLEERLRSGLALDLQLHVYQPSAGSQCRTEWQPFSEWRNS